MKFILKTTILLWLALTMGCSSKMYVRNQTRSSDNRSKSVQHEPLAIDTTSKSKGTIVGCVRSLSDGKPDSNAGLLIPAADLGAMADSGGRFLITQITPGAYDVVAYESGYHKSVYTDVRVAADSVTILEFWLTPSTIEDRLPTRWISDTSSMRSVKKFLEQGGLSNIPCNLF